MLFRSEVEKQPVPSGEGKEEKRERESDDENLRVMLELNSLNRARALVVLAKRAEKMKLSCFCEIKVVWCHPWPPLFIINSRRA